MKDLVIGIQVTEGESSKAIDAFVHAEQLGIDAAWMTLGGVRIDPTAICVGAALRTERIKLGTSIVPIFPRHPWALAQEAKVVAELAPGRFRLGVGPSHKESVESSWGITFESPLPYMREYVELLDAALRSGGAQKHDGTYFHVEADWGNPSSSRSWSPHSVSTRSSLLANAPTAALAGSHHSRTLSE